MIRSSLLRSFACLLVLPMLSVGASGEGFGSGSQRHYGEGEHGGRKLSATEILNIVGAGIKLGTSLTQGQRSQVRQRYQWQGNSTQSRTVYRQSTKTVVPKNTLVKPKREKPQKNQNANALLLTKLRQKQAPLSQITDAKQQAILAETGGQLDVAMIERMRAAGVPPAVIQEWLQITAGKSPSSEELRDFLAGRGDKLPAEAKSMLRTRVAITEYQEQLNLGQLTDAGKQQALADLQASVAALPGTSLLETSLQEKVARMQDLNNLGTLANIAVATDDPLGLIITGATNAQLPIALVSEMTTLPLLDDEAVANSSAIQPVYSYLMNPADSPGEVSYLIDNTKYSMPPGFNQRLSRRRTIEFDTGAGIRKRYTLSDNTYEWIHRDSGWDLQRRQIEITIDNTHYDADFHYVVDGKQAVVKAGSTAKHSSKLPIELLFDQGNGDEPVRKLLKGGEFQVGVNAEKRQLDLFPVDVASLNVSAGAGQTSREVNAQIETLLGQLKKD